MQVLIVLIGSYLRLTESTNSDEIDSGFSPSPDRSPLDSSLEHSPKDLQRLISRHNVISRSDNLILEPQELPNNVSPIQTEDGSSNPSLSQLDQDQTSLAVKLLGGKKVSAATFQKEFVLSDVLEYVKTGVASIIEDEVTQRFEAEELKSWNLLTRTNHKFRFINWKLSFFWCFGFFFRYCILLPGRAAIFVVGVSVLRSDPTESLTELFSFYTWQSECLSSGLSKMDPSNGGSITRSPRRVSRLHSSGIYDSNLSVSSSGPRRSHFCCDHLSQY